MLNFSGSSLSTRVAAGVFLVAFSLRLLALNGLSGTTYFLPVDGDTGFYQAWALRILGGRWTEGLAFYGLPGYAYLLALLYSVVGAQPFIAGLLQSAVDSGTCLIIYQFALWMGRGKAEADPTGTSAMPAAVIASLGWAFFLPAQAFSIVLMPTSLLVFIYWLLLASVARTSSDSLWRPWLYLGAVVGAVAMVVATVFFLIPAIVFAIVRNQWPHPSPVRMGRAAVAVAVLMSGVLVGVSPAWLHNVLIARENVLLSAHSGINLFVGNNPEATGYPKMPLGMRAGQAEMMEDSLRFAEAAERRPLKRSEVSRYWTEKANGFIRGDRPAWLRLLGTKIRNFWSSYQYDDLSLIATLQSDRILLPGLSFGVVATLGLGGTFLTVRSWPRTGWAVAGVVLHMLAIVPVFVTERYRLAAVPGLLILGAGGLVLFAEALACRRWQRVSIYVGATLVAAIFVSWPQRDEQLWSLDQYNIGIKATEAGQIDEAEKRLLRAYHYVPENAEINFALGNVMLARQDTFKAKMWFRQALSLNPGHAGTLNNLGVLALEEERWPIAQRFFEQSLADQPRDAKTNYLLAKAALENGDLETASAAIAIALAGRPEQPEFLELRDEIEQKEENR
ncbi:MAG: tetratricopeptide repeat protein [Pirellulaceae bacterium]|nr:tetratricopeptide repeat protein [Pirellulaceae bacterium]